MMDQRKRELDHAWGMFALVCLVTLLNFRTHWQEESLKAHDRWFSALGASIDRHSAELDSIGAYIIPMSKRIAGMERAVAKLEQKPTVRGEEVQKDEAPR